MPGAQARRMQQTPLRTRCRLASFVIAGLVLLGVGCGDDGSTAADVERGLRPGSEGRAVSLGRRSTRCGAPARPPLVSTVGPGAEFPAEDVGALQSPCPDAPSPRIDVRVEADSVLVDFSTVRDPGLFPPGEFEGYVVYFARECPDMALSSASVDEALSNVRVGAHDVRTHFDRLDINLEGVRYDEESFIKIDLSSVYVDCVRD